MIYRFGLLVFKLSSRLSDEWTRRNGNENFHNRIRVQSKCERQSRGKKLSRGGKSNVRLLRDFFEIFSSSSDWMRIKRYVGLLVFKFDWCRNYLTSTTMVSMLWSVFVWFVMVDWFWESWRRSEVSSEGFQRSSRWSEVVWNLSCSRLAELTRISNKNLQQIFRLPSRSSKPSSMTIETSTLPPHSTCLKPNKQQRLQRLLLSPEGIHKSKIF